MGFLCKKGELRRISCVACTRTHIAPLPRLLVFFPFWLATSSRNSTKMSNKILH